MRALDFNYHLPENLIAQQPASPRDHSKLMVLNKTKQTIEHKKFFDLPDYLQAGDVLVFNNSKVFKARLLGGFSLEEIKDQKVEIFLLQKISNKQEQWQVLAKPGKKFITGKKIYFAKNFFAESLGRYDEQTFLIKFNLQGDKFWRALQRHGQIPTPPYIKQKITDFKKYQTIYSKDAGSTAAPTAGLHFTNRLIKKLKQQGVQLEYVTLHVGLGTFLPVKTDYLEQHQMHSEMAIIDQATANRINKAKAEHRRVIAVGTTACRVLESSAIAPQKLQALAGQTNIFIYPPYKFKIIDGLITNFHLPQSTLLMLVSAFAQPSTSKNILAGRDFILQAYQTAIDNNYRFFSFGDAMFIS